MRLEEGSLVSGLFLVPSLGDSAARTWDRAVLKWDTDSLTLPPNPPHP